METKETGTEHKQNSIKEYQNDGSFKQTPKICDRNYSSRGWWSRKDGGPGPGGGTGLEQGAKVEQLGSETTIAGQLEYQTTPAKQMEERT
ncbi:hypothetical protein QQF64_006754 [Cirrhinus molitorella]|uniref:Uncharacterized protein n=1 Tax=Cirrhinus molitorella TaxID=172907 RepID=A0ABR3MBT7_9TELE